MNHGEHGGHGVFDDSFIHKVWPYISSPSWCPVFPVFPVVSSVLRQPPGLGKSYNLPEKSAFFWLCPFLNRPLKMRVIQSIVN